MDDVYKRLFFDKVTDKFLKELRYLKDDTLYKIVWSLIKSDIIQVSATSVKWEAIKEIIAERGKEMSPKVLADLLVLSTMEANPSETKQIDLFSKVEKDLIAKTKAMVLEDLINLLWTAQKIDRGSLVFFDRLEKELTKRIRGIKDDQFELLMRCFVGEKSEESLSQFSNKFMDLVIQVIQDKRDRFQLKTIVHLMWSCARIDFTNEDYQILDLLKSFASYERLLAGLPAMQQKNIVILLWTYTRDSRLTDNEEC